MVCRFLPVVNQLIMTVFITRTIYGTKSIFVAIKRSITEESSMYNG